MTELKAIDKGLIEEKIEVKNVAWGGGGRIQVEETNTNFTQNVIEKLWECFYLLLNNNVISPGMYRNSNQLPFFHITEYGKECIFSKEVLPYDIDNYQNKLKNILNSDNWVIFYMEEALKCFNVKKTFKIINTLKLWRNSYERK